MSFFTCMALFAAIPAILLGISAYQNKGRSRRWKAGFRS